MSRTKSASFSGSGAVANGSTEQRGKADAERRALRQNIRWLSVGNVLYSLSQAAILIALANLTSPEDVGEYTLGLAVAGPIVLFAEFRVRETLATDANRSFGFGDYLWFSLASVVIAMAVVCAVAVSFYSFAGVLWVVVLVGLVKAVESLVNVVYGLQQREQRMKSVATSMIARGLSGLAGLAVGLVVFGELQAGLFCWFLAWLAALLVLDLPRAIGLVRDVGETLTKPDSHTLRQLLVTVFPLGVTSIVISLTATIPRVVLERSAGLEELGVFGVVAYSVVAVSTLARAISQASAPAMAQCYTRNDTSGFRSIALRSVGSTAGLGIFGVFFSLFAGETALSLTFGEEYRSGANTLTLVMVYGVLLFASMPLTQAMVASRQMYSQIPLFAAVLATATVASVLTIPRYGIEGAAFALIAAGAVRLVGSLLLLRGPLGLGQPRQIVGSA